MTDATTYVSTRDIQAAVSGRETQVLDAIGIDWRRGRPHILCPYPHHNDHDPSWRWDEQHAKAHCTCSKADNIFGVLMKMEGSDFDAAKLRIAQLINRTDLIRERSSGQLFQATDAESLLNPPIQQRDNELVARYLAHRLDLPLEAVLLPSTPAHGWQRLGYFDAPPQGQGRGRQAKSVHVGDFPCAVFGTLDAEGRRHAHRIYLAPGGVGKADLGVSPSGQRRDPKKSAKVVDGQSTAGRSVLWGDPQRATTALLCEGIETAAAVAVAFRDGIAAGHYTIAAGISATGLEAFIPWPTMRHVVVCADRDEAVKPSGAPGSRRGETAARTLALKLHGTHSVAIALPGASGETVDWLDIHCRSGSDAVRQGVLAAVPFVPSETEQQQQSLRSRATVETSGNRLGLSPAVS